MKIQLQPRRHQGSVLLICLGSAAIIGIALATFLLMVQGEYATTNRSQAWNSAMAEAEAGIEETMALINRYVASGNPLSSWQGTATADGWTQNGSVFTLNRRFSGGYYSICLTNGGSGNMWIKSTGTILWTNGAVTPISRAVLVQVGGTSAFLGALLAKQGITLSGGTLVDSFNSQDPLYSSNGQYVVSRHEANGNIMSDASNVVLTAEVTMSGAVNVFGKVFLGPNDSLTYNGQATVGDLNWAGPGPEPGWVINTANFVIPDAPPVPNVSWFPMPAETGSVYIFSGLGPGTTNYYQIPSSFHNLSGQNSILITNGTVFVVAQADNFQMSGQSALTIAPGANLVLWLNGSTPAISGQGIVNNSGNATNVTVYGTTNCTSIAYSGNASFIGTIYAPEAAIKWSGNAAIVGSAVAFSFNDSGGADFHYDEGLQGQLSGSYIISSWTEVPP